MTSPIRLAFAATLVLLAACPHPRSTTHPSFGPEADAPWALEDDDDWNEVRDQMFGLADDDPHRAPLRQQLATAQGARIGRWLDADRPALAYQALVELVGLWGDDPDHLGADLAGEKAVIERARAAFAKSGAEQETVLALAVLAEIEPAERDHRWSEIDEVLSYADEMASAQAGEAAGKARPIDLLEPAAMAWPLKKITDRFVELVVARQQAVAAALAKQGASFELPHIQRGVIDAARQIAGALARAGRIGEIAAQLKPMVGIGGDEDLTRLAIAAGAASATATDYVHLASGFRSRDDADDDAVASRAAARAGLVKFASDATLAAAMARASSDLGRVREPIRIYEALAKRGAGDAEVAENLASLYQERLAALALSGRPVAARGELTAFEHFDQDSAARYPAEAWKTRLAAALATMGRGLVSQGELDEAGQLLERSVELVPDTDAFETLATVALKRERWKDAARWAEAGADAAGASSVARAKLLKIAGDAAHGAGDDERAKDRWLSALSIWADLGDTSQLGPTIGGLRLVQGGELMWSLGQKDEALRLLDASVDVDTDGPDTYTEVVAFFLVHGDDTRALDAFHRAVIDDKIGPYFKVYMSLWMLVEARRRGVAADPLATSYLQGRDGKLWYDDLARLATGRAQLSALTPRATTRSKKAELDYYTAGLGLDDGAGPDAEKALLESVVSTDMVLFFEYDMARHQLAAR